MSYVELRSEALELVDLIVSLEKEKILIETKKGKKPYNIRIQDAKKRLSEINKVFKKASRARDMEFYVQFHRYAHERLPHNTYRVLRKMAGLGVKDKFGAFFDFKVPNPDDYVQIE